MSCRRTACTSRSPGRRRCGTFPTARWRAANSPPIWCPRRWAGISCPTPSFVTGPPVSGMLQLWVDQPGDEVGDEPRARARTSSTCCPPARPGRLSAGAAGLRLRRRRGHAGARRRHPAAPDGGVRRADQQRRPQGRARPVRRRRTASTASTTASACTSRTSCAPCCGAGPASPSTTRRWRRSRGWVSSCGAISVGELREHITGREVDALRRRTVGLLDNPVMPTPDRRRPIPWPAF